MVGFTVVGVPRYFLNWEDQGTQMMDGAWLL